MQVQERPSFNELLQKKWDQGKFVCVGLDPDLTKLPNYLFEYAAVMSGDDWEKGAEQREEIFDSFLKPIIDETADTVCAYKPNLAFYEGWGDVGWVTLQDAVDYIKENYPDIPIIGDGKRADIANTNKGYAMMSSMSVGFDAMTTNPYFGHDTYAPFLAYKGRGLITMCKTTNPGAPFIQDAPVVLEHYHLQQQEAGTPLTQEEYNALLEAALRFRSDREKELFGASTIPAYWIVAARTATLAKENPNIGIVVGATHPEAFAPVRRLAGDMTFLIPGIGTQGGDLEKTLKYAPNSKDQGFIINSSSGIIFASGGKDFAKAARKATLKLHDQITQLKTA